MCAYVSTHSFQTFKKNRFFSANIGSTHSVTGSSRLRDVTGGMIVSARGPPTGPTSSGVFASVRGLRPGPRASGCQRRFRGIALRDAKLGRRAGHAGSTLQSSHSEKDFPLHLNADEWARNHPAHQPSGTFRVFGRPKNLVRNRRVE